MDTYRRITTGLVLVAISCGGAPVAASPNPARAEATAANTPAPSPAAAHIVALRQGGLYLLIRHGVADLPGAKRLAWGTPEGAGIDLDDCETQVNLSDAAKREVAIMAKDLAELRIPVGTVLASPYCRTMETARMLFGKATPSELLLRGSYVPLPGRPTPPSTETRLVELKRMVTAVPAAGINVALITHGDVIRSLVNVEADMGETVIARSASSVLVVVARITATGWRSQ